MNATAIPEAEIAAAYAAALSYARTSASRGGDDLSERLIDAATDVVLWARDHYDPGRGKPFGAWCHGCVSLAVRRATHRAASYPRPDRGRGRPADDAARDDPPARAEGMPTDRPTVEAFADLPDDLRFTARLTCVDGYSYEDAGLLTGVSKEAVRLRLIRAAKLVAAATA